LNSMSTFVISLGGSLVCPEVGRVNIEFLKKFRAVILKYVKRGDKFAIIVGGGKLARAWQDAARKLITPPAPPHNPHPTLSPRERDAEGGVRGGRERLLDWVGIRATQLNAELVRVMFGDVAHYVVVYNPAEKVKTFCIMVGAGYLPGHSTDYDAVVRAKTVGAKVVINLSNVAYVYDKDPRKFKDAKPLKQISWKEYFKMFGTKWVPGANMPFDQKAAQLASKSGMQVVFLGGDDLNNFERFLQGKAFRGTMIGDLKILRPRRIRLGRKI